MEEKITVMISFFLRSYFDPLWLQLFWYHWFLMIRDCILQGPTENHMYVKWAPCWKIIIIIIIIVIVIVIVIVVVVVVIVIIIIITVSLPIWAINMSSRSVDSRRILQSKLSPPGARPPCSMIVCKETVKAFSEVKEEKKSYAHELVLRTSFWGKLYLLLILSRALSSFLCACFVVRVCPERKVMFS